MIYLSTEQLKILSETGSVKIFDEESPIVIEKETLDIDVADLAAGKTGRTPDGVEISY